MSTVLPFKRPKAAPRGLCQHGHHRWVVCKNTRFDVKQGRLLTLLRCERCGQEKTEAR